MMHGDDVDQAVEARVAEAGAASFHFQQFAIRLPDCSAQALLKTNEQGTTIINDEPTHEYGLFAHEYTHYLQAMGTVLGQAIMLNWFATVVGVAQALEKAPAIKVPFSKSALTCPYHRNALKVWNDYIYELNELIGCQLPLRPEGEADATDEFDFYDYEYRHPVDGKTYPGIAVALPTESGGKIGVPLQGDVFFEGWAQCVQWLVDGAEQSIEDRLAARPVDPKQTKHKVYYTTIVRIVLKRLPMFDPLRTTIMLCDAALCTRRPAEAFVKALRVMERCADHLSRTPDPLRAARVAFDQLDDWREGRAVILARLAERASDFEGADGDTAANFMRIMTDLMVRSWNARNADPTWMLDPQYRHDWIARMVEAVGGPPLFLDGRDDAFPMTGEFWVTKTAFWSRGSYDLLEEMICHSFTRECPFLRTKICDSKIVKKTESCRTGNVLDAPVCDGRTCHVGVAGRGMGLHGRKWRRV